MTLPFALRTAFVSLPRPVKQLLAVFVDGGLLLAAFHLAVWLRFELFFFTIHYFMLSLVAAISGVTALALFGVYFYILRYMNERVIMAIAGSVIVSVMTVVSVATFLRLPSGLSRGVLVIYTLAALVALLGLRFGTRRLLYPGSTGSRQDPRVPVVIYGAGSAGSQLASALAGSPHYKPVALLDDDPAKQRLVTAGMRIYPSSHLDKLVRHHEVQQLLIAMPTAPRQRIREIVERIEPYRLRVRLVPSLRDMVDQANHLRLRDLQVEDLLGRDPIAPLPDLLGRCVTGRSVMVTGAGGSIGSELCRQILALRPSRLVLYEISEPALYVLSQELTQLNAGGSVEIINTLGSVRDAAHCLQCMRKHGVQTIYHAAAYKHVPIVEDNIEEGLRTNALGTYITAHAAVEAGVRDFVLISTDKAVRPANVMGASKRLAELILQGCAQIQDGTRFCMVRFGNVLGSSGSVVPLFSKQIRAGGPITLTHPDITRYFMTIPEAAQLVLQAGSMGESGSVFVLDMGEPVRIQDLARRMVHLHGLTVREPEQPDGDIEIRITGLRPGEKLYEELLIGDDALPTPHPRIMRARERELPYETVKGGLLDICNNLDAGNEEAILRGLHSLIPEYSRLYRR